MLLPSRTLHDDDVCTYLTSKYLPYCMQLRYRDYKLPLMKL